MSRLFNALKYFVKTFVKPYRKFIIAALQAAIVAGASVATHGISSEEWGYIILSAGAAIGVFATPNKPTEGK